MSRRGKVEIVWALTHLVRVFLLWQLARTWWSQSPDPARACRRWIMRREQDGLLRVIHGSAIELNLKTPLVSWQPGDELPKFSQIEYQLRYRWRQPLVPAMCITATPKASRQLGGYISPVRDLEVVHDVNVAAVWLRLRETDPQLARRWISDDELYARGYGRGDTLPDAVIQARGRTRKVIELAGKYSVTRLREIHDFAARRKLPYELW